MLVQLTNVDNTERASNPPFDIDTSEETEQLDFDSAIREFDTDVFGIDENNNQFHGINNDKLVVGENVDVNKESDVDSEKNESDSDYVHQGSDIGENVDVINEDDVNRNKSENDRAGVNDENNKINDVNRNNESENCFDFGYSDISECDDIIESDSDQDNEETYNERDNASGNNDGCNDTNNSDNDSADMINNNVNDNSSDENSNNDGADGNYVNDVNFDDNSVYNSGENSERNNEYKRNCSSDEDYILISSEDENESNETAVEKASTLYKTRVWTCTVTKRLCIRDGQEYVLSATKEFDYFEFDK
ncbi:myb-like protein D [Mercenaria mercenaria]|uniref:myb-like protein D n=1 Tax=Mercenaria mercenaria TaxID=6596 RepID=UPI00234EF209|nr:myb-like protein D [Mercenaria mercenaria]